MSSAVDDIVRIDADTGDLTWSTPSLSWANSTINISASCFTELVRGDRKWDDLDRCVEIVWSFFTLRSVRITGIPVRVTWPWDSPEEAAANASAAALSYLAPVPDEAYAGALHITDDHHHHDGDGDGDWYVYPLDLVWIFFLVGFLSLLCGASYNAYYYDDAGNLLYYNGAAYRRVKSPTPSDGGVPGP
jgi:hypothetical protein